MAEQRPVTATFRVIINGFAADLEAAGTLDELVGLTRKLAAHDEIQPGNSPLLWPRKDAGANGAGDSPTCPVHNAPMRPSTKGAGWYCSRKVEDGGYCRAQA
jgi:hypothetical protein